MLGNDQSDRSVPNGSRPRSGCSAGLASCKRTNGVYQHRMPSDERDLIAALEAAVAADESNLVLRAHLAQQLSDAGRHAEALNHASRVLIASPTDLTALAVMAAATAALQGPTPPADTADR